LTRSAFTARAGRRGNLLDLAGQPELLALPLTNP
jgi:hypothetical protein